LNQNHCCFTNTLLLLLLLLLPLLQPLLAAL
jgi:hypothetical protein